ncbi:MAG: FtsX-like permease family protein, partial [Coriobacteriales bacterium]|nr:FtsX-like permease family protein [Coriobacteriales bacterium]
MNIMSKVAFRSLKGNRTRTAVTIIGVMLSVALITAVTSFIASLFDYLVTDEIESNGNWHAEFFAVDSGFSQQLADDEAVQRLIVMQNIGYAQISGVEHSYLFISGFQAADLADMSIHLTAGRLPENSHEILLPNHITDWGDISPYQLGDVITLTVGSRVYDGARLNQNNSFVNSYQSQEGEPSGQEQNSGEDLASADGSASGDPSSVEGLASGDGSASGDSSAFGDGSSIDGSVSGDGSASGDDSASGDGTTSGDGALTSTEPDQSAVSDLGEQFIPEQTLTFTVVGICERPGFETWYSPGYPLLTVWDGDVSAATEDYTLFVLLKQPRQVYDYVDQLVDETPYSLDYRYNNQLLRYLGISRNDFFNQLITTVTAIVVVLIMAGSIMMIYNAFSISVSERSRQFGILTSVGATRKQLRHSVLFEGLCVGALGIPLGILLGLLGIGITLIYVGDILQNLTSSSSELTLSISLPALVIAVVTGLVTILISAFIPAMRTFGKPALAIIRQTDDIKITAKAVKTSKLVNRLFGLEGTLALKNQKRNKKPYRSAIISLFVSLVLFISASSLGMYLQNLTDITIIDYGFDLQVQSVLDYSQEINSDFLQQFDRLSSVSGVTASAYMTEVGYSSSASEAAFTDEYLRLFYQGPSEGETGDRPDIPFTFTIAFIDDATYREYLDDLGLPLDQYGIEAGRLIAVAREQGYSGTDKHSYSMDIFKGDSIKLTLTPSYISLEPASEPTGEPTGEPTDESAGKPTGDSIGELRNGSMTLDFTLVDSAPQLRSG